MYHGGWTKGTYGLESREGRREGRGIEKKEHKVSAHTEKERRRRWRMGRTPVQGWFTTGVLIKQKATPYTKLIRVALLPTRAFFASKIFFSCSLPPCLKIAILFLLPTRMNTYRRCWIFLPFFPPLPLFLFPAHLLFPLFFPLAPLRAFQASSRVILHATNVDSSLFLPNAIFRCDLIEWNSIGRNKKWKWQEWSISLLFKKITYDILRFDFDDIEQTSHLSRVYSTDVSEIVKVSTEQRYINPARWRESWSCQLWIRIPSSSPLGGKIKARPCRVARFIRFEAVRSHAVADLGRKRTNRD